MKGYFGNDALSRSLAAKAEELWNVPVREMYGCTEERDRMTADRHSP